MSREEGERRERMLAELARQQYAAHFAALRTPGTTGLTVLVLAALGGSVLVPSFAELAGHPTWPIAPLVGLVIVIELIMHRLYHRLGAFHPAHVLLERGETWLVTFIGVCAVFLGRSVVSMFWVIPLGQNLLCRIVLNRPYSLAGNASCYALLVAAFAVVGQPREAAVALGIGAIGMAVQWRLGGLEAERLASEAERALLREDLAGLAVEEERGRLVRELHDGVAADMAALLWRLRATKEAPEAMASKAAGLVAELRTMVGELRAGGGGEAAADEVGAEATTEAVEERATEPRAAIVVRVAFVLGATALVWGLALFFSHRGSWGVGRAAFVASAITVAIVVGTRLVARSAQMLRRASAEAEVLAEQLAERRRAWLRRGVAEELRGNIASELATMREQARGLAMNEVGELIDTVAADLEVAVEHQGGEAIALAELAQRVRAKCVELCGERAGVSLRAELAEPEAQASAELAGHVVRIVQEAVHNALRHGAATRVQVELRADALLVIEIADDGTGLSRERFAASRGGLSHMRERLRLLGGNLELLDTAEGTRLRARVPLAA